MKKETREYIQNIKKRLEELGISIRFNDDMSSSASGGTNVFNPIKVEEAKILTAQLKGFEDALELSN